jgi:hypothetical protein
MPPLMSMNTVLADREVADLVPGPERDRDGGGEESEVDDVRERFHDDLSCLAS